MANPVNYGGINFAPYSGVPVNNYFDTFNQGNFNRQSFQRVSDGRTYVNGRAGADAYPMPNGVNVIVLWDTEAKRFYVKGYDNNGMPRVLEDNDYSGHVEPEPAPQSTVDLSNYATREDIKNMIADAFRNISIPNMTGYVTQYDFDKALSELSVGNGGRIVRTNESNG